MGQDRHYKGKNWITKVWGVLDYLAVVLMLSTILACVPAWANEALEIGGGTSIPQETGNIRFVEYDGIATTDNFNLLGGIGYLWDTTPGAKDSLYLRSGLGVVVNNYPGFYPSLYIGPAFVAHTDNVLHTNFQWVVEGNLMFVDSRYVGIALSVLLFVVLVGAFVYEMYVFASYAYQSLEVGLSDLQGHLE